MSETNEQWAQRIAAEQINRIGTLSPELDTQFLALMLERAIQRGYAQGAEFAISCLKSATAKTDDRPSADDVYPHTECEGAMP